MSTAGPNLAGSGTDDASNGNVAWTNPGNVTASDSTFATVALNGSLGDVSHNIKCVSFGFAIAGGNNISGIQVDYARKIDTNASGEAIINLLKAGSTVGTLDDDLTSWTTTSTNTTRGGASSLWGTTWTVSDINNANFGLFIRVANPLSTVRTFSIDYVKITVTYTAAATGYTNLPLLGVGLINTLIHGLTLGLCSWRWRPFTRTQTRTAGVMA